MFISPLPSFNLTKNGPSNSNEPVIMAEPVKGNTFPKSANTVTALLLAVTVKAEPEKLIEVAAVVIKPPSSKISIDTAVEGIENPN